MDGATEKRETGKSGTIKNAMLENEQVEKARPNCQ